MGKTRRDVLVGTMGTTTAALAGCLAATEGTEQASEREITRAVLGSIRSTGAESDCMSTNEECIRDATGLARETVSDGNTPFGSLLVVGDTVVRWSKNTTMTENDITAHPELKLARWAAREFDPDDLANGTMYTSTEPCEMCATAIHYAGLNRVVCSVSGEALADVQEEASGIFCRDVVRRKGGATEVDGPVLETEGIRLHEAVHK